MGAGWTDWLYWGLYGCVMIALLDSADDVGTAPRQDTVDEMPGRILWQWVRHRAREALGDQDMPRRVAHPADCHRMRPGISSTVSCRGAVPTSSAESRSAIMTQPY